MDIGIMSTIADNLQTLINCKTDMKSAIREKEVTVSGGLSTYADAIYDISIEEDDDNSPKYIICEEGLSFNSSADTEYFDLSKIVNAGYLFANESSKLNTTVITPNIKNINLINSNSITNAYYMFFGCSYLKSITGLTTNNVTSMLGMYLSCKSLTQLPEMNTSKVTNMQGFCQDCSKLTSIESLDTHNVVDMRLAFYNCSSLTSLPLMDFSKVVNVQQFFGTNNTITTLGGFKNLGGASEFIGGTYGFLDGCPNLTYESIMNVINNLATAKHTLKLHPTTLAKLSQQDIVKATNKGWTITS